MQDTPPTGSCGGVLWMVPGVCAPGLWDGYAPHTSDIPFLKELKSGSKPKDDDMKPISSDTQDKKLW